MIRLIIKSVFLISIVLFFSNVSFCQNWLPLDKGIGKNSADIRQIFSDSNCIYVTGNFTEDGNNISMRGIAKWNGINWDSVGDANNFNATKYDVFRFQDTLVTATIFYDWPYSSLAKLNGGTWIPYPNSRDLSVNCFLEKDGILYMGGAFDQCGNDSTFGLAMFDGTAFTGMTPCYVYHGANIFSLVFFQDTLYVGGVFDLYPMLPMCSFAKWVDGGLLPVSPEFLNAASAISSMVVYQNELYIGGGFQKSQGFTGDNIMKWNGHNFTEIGGGTNGAVTSMRVYNNELYIGGRFTQVGGSSCQNIAKWDGSQWTCLNNDVFDNYISIKDICIFKDELYVAGVFRKIGNDSIGGIAKYNHSLLSVNSISNQESRLFVYPNPFHETAILQLPDELENVTLIIYDLLGHELKRIATLSGTKINISREGLIDGIYFYKVIDRKGEVGQGKIVVCGE